MLAAEILWNANICFNPTQFPYAYISVKQEVMQHTGKHAPALPLLLLTGYDSRFYSVHFLVIIKQLHVCVCFLLLPHMILYLSLLLIIISSFILKKDFHSFAQFS